MHDRIEFDIVLFDILKAAFTDLITRINIKLEKKGNGAKWMIYIDNTNSIETITLLREKRIYASNIQRKRNFEEIKNPVFPNKWEINIKRLRGNGRLKISYLI